MTGAITLVSCSVEPFQVDMNLQVGAERLLQVTDISLLWFFIISKVVNVSTFVFLCDILFDPQHHPNCIVLKVLLNKLKCLRTALKCIPYEIIAKH